MEDAAPKPDERHHKKQLKRIDNVIAQLRRSYIEPKDKRNSQAKDSSAAKHGIDADKQSNSDTPRQLLRRRAHAKQREDGQRNAPVDPVVMDGIKGVTCAGEFCYRLIHH